MTPGGRARYSDLAIELVLTMPLLFQLALAPRSTAVPSTQADAPPSQRDRHIGLTREKGHMAWQKATGYARRSSVKTGIGRYKAAIGSRPRARTLSGHHGKTAIAVAVLHHVIWTAKPISVRTA